MANSRADKGRGRRSDVVKPAASKPRKPRASKSSLRPFYALLALVAAVGLAAIAWQSSRGSNHPQVTTVDTTIAAGPGEGRLFGNATAPVKILEFADFECPACAQWATITEPDVRSRILGTGLASLRFFDFPLPQHKNSMAASNAAACAAEQGRFWEMHDKLFQGQNDWNTEATSSPKKVFAGYAKDLGLDTDKWGSCFDSQKYQSAILANRGEGERRHLAQTPTFVIGNKMVPGVITYDDMKAMIDSASRAVADAAVSRADSQRKASAKK